MRKTGMPMGRSTKWIRVAIFLLLHHFLQTFVDGLVCNYCYNANFLADCRINSRTCGPEKVCYIEASNITYDEKRHGKHGSKLMNMYRMKCEHYSLCKYRTSHGQGPYGYSKIHIFCCCTDYCEEPDEISWQDPTTVITCPVLWKNRTLTSSAPSPRLSHGVYSGVLAVTAVSLLARLISL